MVQKTQIGNAVINDETDTKGMYEYFRSHALVSDEVTDDIMKYCDFSPNAVKQTDKCNKASEAADKEIGPIDIYNIYAPLCWNTNTTQTPKKASVNPLFFPVTIKTRTQVLLTTAPEMRYLKT